VCWRATATTRRNELRLLDGEKLPRLQPWQSKHPEGTPINFSLDTDLPIVNPAHTPLTFAVYFYGNSAADQSHNYIRYDSAARAIIGALPTVWISTTTGS